MKHIKKVSLVIIAIVSIPFFLFSYINWQFDRPCDTLLGPNYPNIAEWIMADANRMGEPEDKLVSVEITNYNYMRFGSGSVSESYGYRAVLADGRVGVSGALVSCGSIEANEHNMEFE
jgi:hypothetical protein